MDPILIGSLAIAAMLILLATGMPIVWAMSLVAAGGMYLTAGPRFMLATFETLPVAATANYMLVVIPMFLLMGSFCYRAQIIEGLYEAAHRFTARMHGNLLIATVIASALFAATSGSSLAASSMFTRVALPQMVRHGYSASISAACIAATGTLAAIIPPSVAMVIVASLTNQSAGKLLIAGIIPGILTAVIYVVGIKLFLLKYPEWAPRVTERFTLRQKISGLKSLWSVLVLGGFIIGGIYAGWFSPSSAGAVGAAGALLIGLAMRKLTAGSIYESLIESALGTVRLLAIIMAGLLFSRFLVISGFINAVNSTITELQVSAFVLMTCIVLIFLILGMFIDSLSLLVITLPTLYPISQSVGLDPVWFAIIAIKLVEISAITPPVGLNLFAVSGATNLVTTSQLFRGIIPFVLLEMVTLAILLAFPIISTWLPAQM